jgi:hypothetical protein
MPAIQISRLLDLRRVVRLLCSCTCQVVRSVFSISRLSNSDSRPDATMFGSRDNREAIDPRRWFTDNVIVIRYFYLTRMTSDG